MTNWSESDLRALPTIARQAIQAHLAGQTLPEDEHDFSEPAASFVTLTKRGELRGCIGTLQAHQPLYDDVVHNAVAAAFHDPRFSPVQDEELSQIQVEVSVLTDAEIIDFDGDAELFEQLEPNVDGVVIESGLHRATFLPQVWAQLPTHREFFNHLLQKAGLSVNTPLNALRVSKYQVEKIEETRDE